MVNKILIFDPEEKDLMNLKKFLEENGYLVTISGSITDAKSIFNNEKFDLVVTEVDFGGIEFFRYIRSNDKFTSVMIRSNCNDTTQMGMLINEGIDGYLFKIDNMNEVLNQANRILGF